MKKNDPSLPNLSRRKFLKKSSLASLVGLTSTADLRAAAARRPEGPLRADPVNCALIGYGLWGREIADAFSRLPEANLMAICDDYDVMLRRAKRSTPEVETYADYRQVLDNPNVQAVFIATPTHLHRQIAVDALEAGKHVYCEAPMAATIEDARAIALAARARPDQIFQVGQLFRSNPQHRSVFQFVRSGAIGLPVMARAQWHAKESWRRTSPSREREMAQNWRLDADVSTGLMGEACLQQLDVAFWILQTRPKAVTGFGQVMLWKDGRQVPDTIQAVFEFDNGVNMLFDATLASSFDDAYDLYFGSDSTVIFREKGKSWMFKEVDAPMLGWEVYARKDTFYRETGIALVANATKLDAIGQDPAADDPNVESPLWYALKEFTDNFDFGPYLPNANYETGFQAAVSVIKANEAILQNKRIVFEDAWFDLG